MSELNTESAFIGILLSDSRYIINYLSLSKHAFLNGDNQKIFETMKGLYVEKKKYDVISVVEKLEKSVDENYVTGLQGYKQYSNNLDEYGTKIIDNHKMYNVNKIVSEMNQKIITVDEANVKLKEVMYTNENNDRVYNMQEAIHHWSSDHSTKKANSIIDLIQEEGGWSMESNYIIIAARPSKGKTTLLNNITNDLRNQGLIGAEFSSEVSLKQSMDMKISSESRVNNLVIKNRDMISGKNLHKVEMTLEKLYGQQYYICDIPNIDINRLLSIAHSWNDIQFLGIDYLQLLNARHMTREKRHEQLSYISGELKQLARDKNIPVFALAQLNRNADDRKPRLSDLKDCGQFEQDADVIMFIHVTDEEKNKAEPIVDIMLAKNKFGATGETKMRFRKDICRFETITKL